MTLTKGGMHHTACNPVAEYYQSPLYLSIVQLIVEWLWISANIKVVPRYPWWEDEFPIGVMEGIHFQIPQINLF